MGKDDVIRETVASYDITAEQYTEEWFDRGLDDHLARFAEMLPQGGCVLDVGGGHGRDSLALALMGFDMFLIDLSTRLMAAGRRRGVAVPMAQADLRFMPFRDACFDGLWACASLVHLPRADMTPALREMARVTVPGGVLFLSMRTGRGSGWECLQGGLRRFYTYCSGDEVIGCLTESGWDPLSWQEDPPHWFSVLSRRKEIP